MHPVNERLIQPGGLAERLLNLRRAAGLTGDELAADLHWPRSKISKIENGRQMPSAEDIRAWTRATGQPGDATELLDLLAEAQSVQTRWRRRLRQGHAPVQEEIDRRTREAKHIRNAEALIIPGLLQTPGYARAIAVQIAEIFGTADIDAAVETRMRRQEILYDQSKTFEFVVSEAALRMPPCPPQAMLGQLDRLLMSMDLGNVTFAVIPMGRELGQTLYNGFLMLDDTLIVESFREEDQGSDEVEAHARIFERLMAESVTGEEARRLIQAAAGSLRDTSTGGPMT